MGKGRYILVVLVLLPGFFGCQANKPSEDEDMYIKGLRLFQEMKYEDISQIFGTSVGALKASYHLAVKKIEEYFNSHD